MRRRPKRRLFKLGSHKVVLNWAGRPASELVLIGEQYRRAARVLVREFAAKRGYSDLEAYPIVFNYLSLAKTLIYFWNNGLEVCDDCPFPARTSSCSSGRN